MPSQAVVRPWLPRKFLAQHFCRVAARMHQATQAGSNPQCLYACRHKAMMAQL